MEIEDIEKFERKLGKASTIKADDIIPTYVDRVGKFLKDNQGTMGDAWVEDSARKLYIFKKNSGGDVIQSNIYTGVALATFLPEVPLITGQQLLSLYKQAGNKNPFGDVYIDFGIQINGKPEINSGQARILSKDFKSRDIKIEDRKVPNFNQLKLIADKDTGLAYRLTEDASKENIAEVFEYPISNDYIGKNGLFRAYLNRGSDWYADGGGLSFSYDYGRVVRYDTEGVVPKKLSQKKLKIDLVQKLSDNFLERF